MKATRWVLGIGVAVVIAALAAAVYDSSISLTYSRAENRSLLKKCELLANLASYGMQGRPVIDAKRAGGQGITVEESGTELVFEGVVFKVADGKIQEMSTKEVCQ